MTVGFDHQSLFLTYKLMTAGRYLVLLCVVMFVSCTDQFSAVQQMNKFGEIPVGITEDLHLIYSDSARKEAISLFGVS